MLNTNIIPARSLQKSYRAIIDDVKNKKEAVVLTTNKKPQVALVSLEDLERLQRSKATQSNFNLLELALKNKKDLKNLPADLRKRANDILYNRKWPK